MTRGIAPIWAFGLLIVGLAGAPCRGQEPAPRVYDPQQRSGLLSRYAPVLPKLPPDDDRDAFQGTRFADEQDDATCLVHPYNSWRNGGMYGYPLCPNCTAAVTPFFRGSPGRSTITDECRSHHPALRRWVGNAINPWKPVGMYYDRGVYTPIYDFDWFVPGPGPFPWSHFFKRPTGG
jgi:hypothetical protein